MKLRITLFATLLVLLSACFTGCKKELKDFSFSYSMESVDNYKLMVLFDSDKTFRIEEYNYYMDNFAKKRDPKIMEGTLTDEEFASLKPILQKCNFFAAVGICFSNQRFHHIKQIFVSDNSAVAPFQSVLGLI